MCIFHVNVLFFQDHPYQPAYGNSILDYNDSTMINGNGVADGRSSYLSTEMGKTGFYMTFGGLQSRTMDYETSIQRKKRKPTASSTSASKRVQRTIKEEVQETLDEKPHRVNGFVGNEEDKDCCSIERIVDALETVPDMNDELFLEASQILEDERKAKMFVAMDVTARQKWLFRKLRQ